MFDWVNSRHQKAKMEQEKGCPFCGAKEEISEYILQCKDKQMSKVRDEIITTIMKTLRGIKCPDQIISLFIEELRCLCSGKEIEIMENVGQEISEAKEDQNILGKHFMLRGGI